MNHMGGWMGGFLWPTTLVVILVVVVIVLMVRKRP